MTEKTNKTFHGARRTSDFPTSCDMEYIVLSPYLGRCPGKCKFCPSYLSRFGFDLYVDKDYVDYVVSKFETLSVAFTVLMRGSLLFGIEDKYDITYNLLKHLNSIGIPVGVFTRTPIPDRFLELLSGNKDNFVVFLITGLSESHNKIVSPITDYDKLLRNIEKVRDSGLHTVLEFSPIIPLSEHYVDDVLSLLSSAMRYVNHVVLSTIKLSVYHFNRFFESIPLDTANLRQSFDERVVAKTGKTTGFRIINYNERYRLFTEVKQFIRSFNQRYKTNVTLALEDEFRFDEIVPVDLNSEFRTSCCQFGKVSKIMYKVDNKFVPFIPCIGNCDNCENYCGIERLKLEKPNKYSDFRRMRLK